MNTLRLQRFIGFLLLYMLAVVAWGGFTRASYSGDGCGEHWPLCDGKVIPPLKDFQQWVEFSHRISSAIAGFLVIGMVVWVFRMFARGDAGGWFRRVFWENPVRRAASLTLFFTITEGLIGAALVLFGLVDRKDSVVRTISMCLHLINTFFLLGALVMTLLLVTGLRTHGPRGQGAVGWGMRVGFASVVLVGLSGACSALGHMLLKGDVIHSAMQTGAHYLYRLQVLHPLIATSVGLYLVFLAGILNHFRPDPMVKRAVKWVLWVYGLQMVLGVANVWLKAPIWMQVTHLVLADVLWIALVVAAAYATREGVVHVEDSFEAAPAGPRPTGTALLKQYVALTKPRVISLLLFTTLATMFIAAKGWPGGWLLMAVAIGGYLAAGAANAINMVIDRDIDGTMKRTATRPTVTQDISSPSALAFGFGLAAVSFTLLAIAANLLTAAMALAGLVFYVVVYTLILKRRTWQNIVIGGAAGAFPPLVGWAAVTNELPVFAWVLFALIFVWTPVHFWALALLIKDDYAAAGVPMLPVVRGDRVTVQQIGLYTLLTIAVTVVPFVQGHVGWLYLSVAIVLNLYLAVLCVQLYRIVDRQRASKLFHYSMLYLALLFLVVAIDRAVLV